MPESRGPRNVHLGAPDTWVEPVYDTDAREYVVTLTEANAKKFRPLAEEYGFTEVKKADKKADNSEE